MPLQSLAAWHYHEKSAGDEYDLGHDHGHLLDLQQDD